MSTASSIRAPRIPPAALQARVRRLLRPSHSNPGSAALPVMLFRGQPEWTGPPEFSVAGRVVRVVPCVSPLAVVELVTRHTAEAGDGVLALITDADEAALGDAVLSQVHRHRIDVIEPWTAVEEDFGATRMDPRLVDERWAAQALLEARPAGGWPRLAGATLTRDIALGELAVSRLGLDELGLRSADLDAATLLRWSATPGATDAFRQLRTEERDGLIDWLVSRTGRVARALFALVDAGHGADALPLGLVCDCLWQAATSPTGGAAGATDPAQAQVVAGVERAKGRVDLYFGDTHLDDVTVRAFADAVRGVVRTTLDLARPRAGRFGIAPLGFTPAGTLHPDEEVGALLDRAERLLDQFGGREAGAASDILPTGFDHRLHVVATTVHDFLAVSRTVSGSFAGVALAAVAQPVADAVAALRRHHLAGRHPDRIERAAMAARVVCWLAGQTAATTSSTSRRGAAASDRQTPAGGPITLAAGLDAYLGDWAWLDVALGQLWVGDGDRKLGSAYGELYTAAAGRRRDLDDAFARELARWTALGAPATANPARPVGGDVEPLLVEEILHRVVAPALRRRDGTSDSRSGIRMLLVVLDGMSAAVAAQLGQDLRREGWAEFDPLGDPAAAASDRPRRRSAVAVLPTVTSVSRASLLAGRLVEGDQDLERREFEKLPHWRGRTARLFHSGDLRGTPGAPLGDELTAALVGDATLVGVVVNTVDDSLDTGRERYDAGWAVNDIGALRAVLDLARTAGRAVVLTSDHGHVVDHGGEPRRVDDALSARHRSGVGPVGAGEVELTGSRVLTDSGRLVALWDASLRYTARKAGYHGGASPAEVVVPVLAFLPFAPTANSDVPPGWRPLPDQRPGWWSLDRTNVVTGSGDATVHLGRTPQSGVGVGVGSGDEPTTTIRSRGRRRAEQPAGPALFDLPADEPTPDEPAPSAQAPAAAATTASDALVAALLAAELFQAQLSATPRAVPVGKVEAAVRALLDANGTLAAAVVAERAGERPVRFAGFAVTLQRIFNVDNYPVLSLIDDGRTLRLDVGLLREQFGLPSPPGASR